MNEYTFQSAFLIWKNRVAYFFCFLTKIGTCVRWRVKFPLNICIRQDKQNSHHFFNISLLISPNILFGLYLGTRDLEIKATKSLSYEWKHISKPNNAIRMRQKRTAYYSCRIIICCDIDSRGLVVNADGSGFWIQDKLCTGNVQGCFGRLPTKVISTEKNSTAVSFFNVDDKFNLPFLVLLETSTRQREKVSFIYEIEAKKYELKYNLRLLVSRLLNPSR